MRLPHAGVRRILLTIRLAGGAAGATPAAPVDYAMTPEVGARGLGGF